MLRKGGTLLLVVKSRSIDVLAKPEHVFRQEVKKLEGAGFKVERVYELSPFEKDHALIHALMPA
jgi:fibrillarin-like pre-rRNA processing protein